LLRGPRPADRRARLVRPTARGTDVLRILTPSSPAWEPEASELIEDRPRKISIAEAARKEKVSEQSIGRWKAEFIEAGRTARVAGRSGRSSLP
jgi:hypothetical protein